MYVCLCHGVTDSAIRRAVDEGVSTFKELSLKTGCATQCGSCAVSAKEILKQARAEQVQIALPVIESPAFAA